MNSGSWLELFGARKIPLSLDFVHAAVIPMDFGHGRNVNEYNSDVK
jgi:hypothetical protein